MWMFERTDVIVMALVATTAALIACVWLLPNEWALLWRIGAGLVLGFATTMMLFANRMIGGADFN